MTTEVKEIKCPTCEQVFKEERSLSKHLVKKIPCIPKGQARHSCQACNQTFERKNDLAKHLTTKKHADAVARANSTDSSHTLTGDATYKYTIANPPPRPRMFGRSDLLHVVDMTSEELDKHLHLRTRTGLTLFLNLFKLMHLNDDAPKNHNVMIESPDAPFAWVFKQKHWRRVDADGIVRDCLLQTTVLALDFEFAIQEAMDEAHYCKFIKLRGQVEFETCGPRPLSPGVSSLLKRICVAIVAFTDRHPDLLHYARADSETAPPMVALPRQRTLSMWQPGGVRYEAFRETRETEDHARLPSTPESSIYDVKSCNDASPIQGPMPSS